MSSSDSGDSRMKLSVLLPLIVAVLLLLLVAASLLAWRMVKRQKKGERTWLQLGWGRAGWKGVGLMASLVIREPSGQGVTCVVWQGRSPKGHRHLSPGGVGISCPPCMSSLLSSPL